MPSVDGVLASTAIIGCGFSLILIIPCLLLGILWEADSRNVNLNASSLTFLKTHCVVSDISAFPYKGPCLFKLFCPSKEYVIEDISNASAIFVASYGLATNRTFLHGRNGIVIDRTPAFENDNAGCGSRNAWGMNRLFLCYIPPEPDKMYTQITMESVRLPSGKVSAEQAQRDIDTVDKRFATYIEANSGIRPIGIAFIVLMSMCGFYILWFVFVMSITRNVDAVPQEEQVDPAAPRVDNDILADEPDQDAVLVATQNKKKKRRKKRPLDQSEMALLCSHCGAKQRANIVVCRKCHRANVEQFQAVVVTDNELLDQECVICLDDLSPGDEVIFLRCLHPFHKDCIAGWFNDKRHAQCPICKAAVDVEGE